MPTENQKAYQERLSIEAFEAHLLLLVQHGDRLALEEKRGGGAKKKYNHICPTGHFFLMQIGNYKRSPFEGTKCPICNNCSKGTAKDKHYSLMTKRGDRMADLNEPWPGTQGKINLICGKNGCFFTTTPNAYKTTGCFQCSDSNTKKVQENFIAYVIAEGYGLGSNFYYKNTHTPVSLICPIGHSYLVTPASFKAKGGARRRCSTCSRKNPMVAHSQFLKNTEEEDYDILDKTCRGNCETKYEAICPLGHTIWILPNSFREGNRCRKCAGLDPETAKVDHFAWFDKLEAEGHYVDRSYYNGSLSVMEGIWKCGHHFRRSVHGLRKTQSCNDCSKHGTSKLQKEIFEFVNELLPNEIIFGNKESETRILADKRSEVDIIAPNLKIAFEICGIYYHSDNGIQESINRRKHYNKYKECESLGIRLVTIFENEWILKPEQTKAYIRSILGKVGKITTIHGRDKFLIIKTVSTADTRDFLDKYHIQGAGAPESLRYGLYYEDVLICVLTASKMAKNELPNGYTEGECMVIKRFANKAGFRIHGGYSKLEKHLSIFNPNVRLLRTFSDNRWSIGDLYNKCGYICDPKEIQIDYTYAAPNWKNAKTGLEHKSNYRVKNICKKWPNRGYEDLTEWEAMKLEGYMRIWDCGKRVWNKIIK